jgi:hypothetical protein
LSNLEIPRHGNATGETQILPASSDTKPDSKLLKSIVRAHVWLTALSASRYGSIDDLAVAASLHPKVIRQGFRMAFLAPELMMTILGGNPAFELKQVPKLLPLSWREQRHLLGR